MQYISFREKYEGDFCLAAEFVMATNKWNIEGVRRAP